MAGVLRGLGDDVEQDAAGRPARAGLEPRRLRQRVRGAPIREQIGRWAEIEPDGDDACIVRMTTDSFDWPAMALGSTGADFDVLSPPELAGYIGEWSARFARAATRSAIAD